MVIIIIGGLLVVFTSCGLVLKKLNYGLRQLHGDF